MDELFLHMFISIATMLAVIHKLSTIVHTWMVSCSISQLDFGIALEGGRKPHYVTMSRGIHDMELGRPVFFEVF